MFTLEINSVDPRPACASETVSKTAIIQWPSAFSPPCRIRVKASPVACTVPGLLSPNVFQKEGRILGIFGSSLLLFGLHVIKKYPKKLSKIP